MNLRWVPLVLAFALAAPTASAGVYADHHLTPQQQKRKEQHREQQLHTQRTQQQHQQQQQVQPKRWSAPAKNPASRTYAPPPSTPRTSGQPRVPQRTIVAASIVDLGRRVKARLWTPWKS